MKRWIAVVVLGLLGLALWWWKRPPVVPTGSDVSVLAVPENTAGKAGELTVTPEAMELAEIRSAPAEVRTVKETLNVSGEIQTGGDQTAKVTPAAAGKVVKLLARVGQAVQAGQVLAVLESAELAQAQADHRRAAAQVRALQSNLARQRELARLGQFARPQVEESRNRALESERDVHAAAHHLQEEEASLQQSEAEASVLGARLQRANSLAEVVSGQDRERMRADYQKALAAASGARARVAGAHGDLGLARKRFSLANVSLAREEKVFSGQHLTSRELVEAESSLDLAQVDLQSAAEKVRLLGGQPGGGSQLSLRSPIRGTVQECSVTLGETVTPERAAYAVVNLDRVWARLAIAGPDLSKVRVGDLVELQADSAPGHVFRGRIESVSAGSDEATRAVYLRALLANPRAELKTGSFVRGQLVTDVRLKRITVPDSALQEHTGRPTLYVARKDAPGTFEVRHVKLGARGPHWREISEGLQAGESLAVNGTFYLKSEALKSSLSDGCCGGD